ncbi:MAG: hypothetical protein AAF213_02730 [Pseudomonadota bacterium]
MSDWQDFCRQTVQDIQQRCPELDGYALFVEPLTHERFITAVRAALGKQPQEFADRVIEQLNLVDRDNQRQANRLYGQGGAFSMTLDLQPGQLEPVSILNPVQHIHAPFQSEPYIPHRISWHSHLGTDHTDGFNQEQATRLMRQSAWHEVGHTMANRWGHTRSFEPEPPRHLAETPTPEDYVSLARHNASEQYADGYSLRQLAQDDLDEALITAVELADHRAINMMESLLKGDEDVLKYSVDPAITAAIKDMPDLAQTAKTGAGTPSKQITEMTNQAVRRGHVPPADLAELAAYGKKLRAGFATSETGFSAELAAMGKEAKGAASYYLVRNYLNAMARYLAPDQPIQTGLEQARHALAANPNAAQWDAANPAADALATATKLHAQRAQPQLAPQPAMALGA